MLHTFHKAERDRESVYVCVRVYACVCVEGEEGEGEGEGDECTPSVAASSRVSYTLYASHPYHTVPIRTAPISTTMSHTVLTAPMSTTMKSVLDGIFLHSSAQNASLATVVPATSVTSDDFVFSGSG